MSRRAEIRMNEREIGGLLDEIRTVALGTIGPDGTPHLTAMWFCLIDGAIHLWTYAKSQKVVNLRRDPRVVVLASAGDVYEDLRGAELTGTARIIDDPVRVLAIGRALGRRYHTFPDDGTLDAWAAAAGRKRVGVRIDVERSASWDHRKL